MISTTTATRCDGRRRHHPHRSGHDRREPVERGVVQQRRLPPHGHLGGSVASLGRSAASEPPRPGRPGARRRARRGRASGRSPRRLRRRGRRRRPRASRARRRPGSTPPRPVRRSAARTPRWTRQPRAGPPSASSRSASSSFVAGSLRAPAAHTTTSPSDHDAWSGQPSSSTSVVVDVVVLAPRRRSRAAGRTPGAGPSSSSAKSAMTCSRSGPVSP